MHQSKLNCVYRYYIVYNIKAKTQHQKLELQFTKTKLMKISVDYIADPKNRNHN